MTSIKEFLELQKELDDFILESTEIEIPKKTLLTDTLLALSVEVSELANATRSFKHWSRKGPMKREMILEEYIDIFHFFLSAGNQLGFKADEIEKMYYRKRQININRQHEDY